MSGKSFADWLDENADDSFDVPAEAEAPLERHARLKAEVDGTSETYIEKCPACGGSGEHWRGGRHLGDCFKCKGKGEKRFKTSPEKRLSAKERKYQQRFETAREALKLDAIAAAMTDDQRAATMVAARLVPKFELRRTDEWSTEQLLHRGQDLTPPEVAWLRHLIRKYRRIYGPDLFARIFPSEVH